MRKQRPAKKPAISCIMIFLNANRHSFFEAAINSVIGQTFKDWELLLVDDGSTDSSTRMAKHYAQSCNGKIRYLEHEGHCNRGMSASRNLGINNARGNYIAFLDADDLWFADQLQQQYSLLEAQPEAAMVWGRTQIWHSWTAQAEDQARDKLSLLGAQPDQLIRPPALVHILLDSHERAIPCVCSVLVRRSIIAELGGFEDEFRGKFEDSIFWLKVFCHQNVFVSSNTWGLYRQHQSNSTVQASSNGEWLRGSLSGSRHRYLIWAENYLSQVGIKDQRVWATIKKELWGYRHRNLYRLLRFLRGLKWTEHAMIKRLGRQILPRTLRRDLGVY